MLILPNDFGGGLGHVKRSLRLALLLKKAGFQICFLCHKQDTLKHLPDGIDGKAVSCRAEKYYTLGRAVFNPIHPSPQLPDKRTPYYWEFDGFDYQCVRDRVFSESIARSRFNRMVKVAAGFKPDMIIGDSNLFSRLIALKLNIPIVQISRSAIFPDNNYMLWWKKKPGNLFAPNTKPIFSTLYKEVEQGDFVNCSSLMVGDGYLIPGNEAIEPIKTNVPALYYGYKITQKEIQTIPVAKNEKHKNILVMMGGGSPRGHLRQLYSDLYDRLANYPVRVIFSDPYKVLEGKTNARDKIKRQDWVESSDIFPQIDLIIHHGGYSTMMESMWWGVPSVIIPSHSEQEGNGRRMEMLNVGKVLAVSPPPYQEIAFKWYLGDYTMNAGFNYELDQKRLYDTLDLIFEDKSVSESIARQKKSLRQEYSEDKILSFINRYIS